MCYFDNILQYGFQNSNTKMLFLEHILHFITYLVNIGHKITILDTKSTFRTKFTTFIQFHTYLVNMSTILHNIHYIITISHIFGHYSLNIHIFGQKTSYLCNIIEFNTYLVVFMLNLLKKLIISWFIHNLDINVQYLVIIHELFTIYSIFL